ncbi:MAG: chemotaxis-specific protein-glutamate methyltransferase CheB [Chitinivibrionales bacterium]|nr:chemotaxis-specific protein-glutamate methyltransferase CheB [Chitinivibrionales bacterium]
MSEKNLKILIVDDSMVFCRIIKEALADEADLSILGFAHNGVEAMVMIKEQKPDLVTLDLEMPQMDGIETLKAIQSYCAGQPAESDIGVIMVSAFTKKGAEATIKALEAGAFDFITKPSDSTEAEYLSNLKRMLLPRIHHFASLKTLGRLPCRKQQPLPEREEMSDDGVAPRIIQAIAIGVSTGGPKALSDIMPGLCMQAQVPIFIVQHMPQEFTACMAESLSKKCSHHVKVGQDEEPVDPNTVYIAPGGQHMLVRMSGAGPVISINDQPPENGCKPSVDVLFRSLPQVYGPQALAIILTGMGIDGSKSLPFLKRSGISIIAQDEASSVVWGMPGSAVESGCVEKIVALQDMVSFVGKIVSRQSTTV